MRKKIFGLLLGATFMFTLTAGVFSAFDANAVEPGVDKWYELNPGQPVDDWCLNMGNDCLAWIQITATD